MANYNAIPYSEKMKIVDLYVRGEKTSVIGVLFGLNGTGTVGNIAREFGIPPREWPKRIPDDVVEAIKQDASTGSYSQPQLATKHGVSKTAVWGILAGNRGHRKRHEQAGLQFDNPRKAGSSS